MTVRPATVALLSMLWIVPAPAQAHAAQDAAPDTPAGASVLQVQDAPNQIITVHTRIRHTTVIQLPAHENILDFVVGDSEYWHLTGAANLAFLKPIGEGVNTNVALVCESGRIYSFLVTERDAPPHLIVRVGSDPDTAPAGVSVPAFVARSRVAEYQLMAEQSREAVHAAQRDAETQIAAMRQDGDRPGRSVSGDLPHPVAVSVCAGRQGRALALPRARHVARRAIYVSPIDRPGDARALREQRRATVPYPVRPRSRRPVYRASPCRVRLAPNRPRTGRLESGPGRTWNKAMPNWNPTERPGRGRIFNDVDHAHRRDRVRPDSRRRVPGAIVLFDGPHRPGVNPRARGDRRQSRHPANSASACRDIEQRAALDAAAAERQLATHGAHLTGGHVDARL